VPVVGAPVQFSLAPGASFEKDSTDPTGKRVLADNATSELGNAFAFVNLGPNQGDQIFSATAGGLAVQFNGYARFYPAIKSNGVVDGASFQVGQGLAPGSYITIYGTALSDATQVESTTSLPVALSDVSVSFDGGGLSLPGHISYVSPGQINVQIPWEFQGQSSVAIKVIVSGLPSSVYTVPLAPASPGVFAIVDATSGAVVTAGTPVKRGDALVIYANGLGAVSNQPASGEPSPAQPLAATSVTPGVTIGGSTATLIFSGLTPGSVGLYQVNVTVPSNAPTGTQPLVIALNGINSQAVSVLVQ
jgi:uncharacterized protein (TIGR03437 family)